MGYLSDKYSDLTPLLKDYVTNTTRGQNVTDIFLSLVNRAQNNLWAKKPWCDLATDVDIVLVGGSYTLPAAFGRIISLWADLAGSGVADYWFYEGNDTAKGYKLRDLFTKAAGHSKVMTFNFAQATSPKMVYQRLLEDFSGTDEEYLFFPLNLMALECQKINLREKGNLKELVAANATFDDEFKVYCNAHQWVNYDPSSVMRDRSGMRIFVETYQLNGEVVSGSNRSVMPNSFLGG